MWIGRWVIKVDQNCFSNHFCLVPHLLLQHKQLCLVPHLKPQHKHLCLVPHLLQQHKSLAVDAFVLEGGAVGFASGNVADEGVDVRRSPAGNGLVARRLGDGRDSWKEEGG